MNQDSQPVERVVGFDAHPDSFTAALLRGPTPAAAFVEKMFNKVPLSRLPSWVKKHTTDKDQFVLEASGNSFHIARSLRAMGRPAKVLESGQLGQLKEAHANNDKISAVRIAKAYLAGTAKEVWIPDQKTQERRDLFHAHRKAVKRTTQTRNRLKSYLSDNGVRLPKAMSLTQDPEEVDRRIGKTHSWSPAQWQIIQGLLLEVRHADAQRAHWRSLIAQEVLSDRELLSIVRLCGVRDMVAFALGALIGDIKRFATPGKLVKYVGLNPAFDDSGNETWSGGIGGHGRKDLRCLLIEAAHAILRASKSDLAKWGKKLLGRKGEIKLVVAAMARKLTVAVWYLMMGRWTPLEDIDDRLVIKVSKIISQVGTDRLKKLGKDRITFREEIYQRLKTGRVQAPPTAKPKPATAAPGKKVRIYVLDPDQKFVPKASGYPPQPAAATSDDKLKVSGG